MDTSAMAEWNLLRTLGCRRPCQTSEDCSTQNHRTQAYTHTRTHQNYAYSTYGKFGGYPSPNADSSPDCRISRLLLISHIYLFLFGQERRTTLQRPYLIVGHACFLDRCSLSRWLVRPLS